MAISLTRAMLTWRVLEELGELRLLHARQGHGPLDEGAVEVRHGLPGGLVVPGHELRGADQVPRRVAGVDALGAVAEEEVGADHQPRRLLEEGPEELLGRARVGGGLEHDQGSGAEEPPEHAGRRLDVRQVGDAVPQRRGHRDDGDVEPGARARLRRRHVPPRLEGGGQGVVGHALDVGLPRGQALHARLVEVEPHHVEPDLDGPHGQGQPHVPLADDHDLPGFSHGG